MARDTRKAMVLTAVELLRERGADGITLDTLVNRSGAPRGSIYHHFPGGRTQILDEAVQLGGDTIASLIADSADGDPIALLDSIAAFWRKTLTDSGFTAGCPVVSAAISSAPDSPLVRHAQQIFATWRGQLIERLTADGLNATTAGRLATMCIAAIQGAIIMCRTEASVQPLDDVAGELQVLLSARSLFCQTDAPADRRGTT
ncbi:TetR/AcrR family transcriptional regulator [Mycolicibacter minnesotensis]